MTARRQAVQGVAALGEQLLAAVLSSLEVNPDTLLDNPLGEQLVLLQEKMAQPTGHELAEDPEAFEAISQVKQQFVGTLMGYLTLQRGRPGVLRKVAELYSLVVMPAVIQELVAEERRSTS